jgi:hypothetical protein
MNHSSHHAARRNAPILIRAFSSRLSPAGLLSAIWFIADFILSALSASYALVSSMTFLHMASDGHFARGAFWSFT